MVLVLWDDSTLDVYETPADVWQSVEGLDVETALEMCDERGQRYVVEWIYPNRYGRILWLLEWCESGIYRLRAEGEPNPALPVSLVERAVCLSNAPGFGTLADVRAALG